MIENRRLIVAFTGPSNSGKTTLIEKIAKELKFRGKMVSIIKNDPKDKAQFDVKGKDSYKFFQTGANVVITSPTRTTYFKNEYQQIDEIISNLGNFDYLLIEGLKTLPFPRISVFRDKIDETYYDFIKAVAIDDSIDNSLVKDSIDILDLNNPNQVIDWIDKNAKEYIK
jgi:molybdopterin-guanine dinucleotide biosynthesis protein B